MLYSLILKTIKKIIFFLCLMLSPLWSHYYTEEMLNNISIEGDVPKKGYIPNKDRSTTSIKEALKAAGFDLRKLLSLIHI